MWNLLLPAYDPAFIGPDFDMDVNGFFREDFPYVFRPFHKAQATGVDVVVEADVEGFGRLFDAVEVEMEDAAAGRRTVLVHYREGGRTHGVFPYSQNTAEGGYEGGFAGAHGGVEGHEGAAAYLREELPCNRVYTAKVFYGESV